MKNTKTYRKQLLRKEKEETALVVYRHPKKTGNPLLDALIESKKIMSAVFVAVIILGCIWLLLDSNLQRLLVELVEKVFW